MRKLILATAALAFVSSTALVPALAQDKAGGTTGTAATSGDTTSKGDKMAPEDRKEGQQGQDRHQDRHREAIRQVTKKAAHGRPFILILAYSLRASTRILRQQQTVRLRGRQLILVSAR